MPPLVLAAVLLQVAVTCQEALAMKGRAVPLPSRMRRRAEAATKTLLKEAKREEQQIAGVMEARASTGVRLVEGPVRRR